MEWNRKNKKKEKWQRRKHIWVERGSRSESRTSSHSRSIISSVIGGQKQDKTNKSVQRWTNPDWISLLTQWPAVHGWDTVLCVPLNLEQEAASLSEIRPVSSPRCTPYDPTTPWPPLTSSVCVRMWHTRSRIHTHTHTCTALNHSLKKWQVQFKSNLAFPGTALECWAVEQTQHRVTYVNAVSMRCSIRLLPNTSPLNAPWQ